MIGQQGIVAIGITMRVGVARERGLGNKGSLRLTHGATVGRNAQPVNGSLLMESRGLALWRAGLGRREPQRRGLGTARVHNGRMAARLTT